MHESTKTLPNSRDEGVMLNVMSLMDMSAFEIKTTAFLISWYAINPKDH